MPKKGYKQSLEQIKKLSLARTGLKRTEETKIKMSLSQRGKPSPFKGVKNRFSKISKIKMKLAKLGSKHPNYRGGIQFQGYDNSYNNIFKETIKKRDNYTCLLCGIKQKIGLQTHHIDYDKLNTTQQNVVTLCKSCHMRTTWNRELWINLFRERLSKKYNYHYNN